MESDEVAAKRLRGQLAELIAELDRLRTNAGRSSAARRLSIAITSLEDADLRLARFAELAALPVPGAV